VGASVSSLLSGFGGFPLFVSVLAPGFVGVGFVFVVFLPWCCFLVFVSFLVRPSRGFAFPGCALVFFDSAFCGYFGVFCTGLFIYIYNIFVIQIKKKVKLRHLPLQCKIQFNFREK